MKSQAAVPTASASSPTRTVGWVAAIIAWCVAAGLVAGWWWMRQWQAPTGQVVDHTWFPSPWDEGNRAAFDATAWFALIGLPLGLVTGLIAGAWARGRETVTVVAVVVGTCLAAVVMWRYGLQVAPPDPDAAARSAADGTRILGTLPRLGVPVFAVVPGAALAGLSAMYLLASRRSH